MMFNRMTVIFVLLLVTLTLGTSCKPKTQSNEDAPPVEDNAAINNKSDGDTPAAQNENEDTPPDDSHDDSDPEVRLTAPEGGLLGDGLRDPSDTTSDENNNDGVELQLRGLGNSGGWRDSTRLRLNP